MHYLLNLAIASSLLLTIALPSPSIPNDVNKETFTKRLENALNTKDLSLLTDILTKQDELTLKNRYSKFINIFPNASWKIQEAKPLKDGRHSLTIFISGEKQLEDEKYTIKSKQIYAFKSFKGQIVNKELMSEETIIQNGENPLEISINVPDTVLTGSNYDFDIIINKPIGNAIIAGALIPISQEQIDNQISPNINLAPLGGGGIFKSIKAPKSEGMQNFSAILAHPGGLISITKRIKVASN